MFTKLRFSVAVFLVLTAWSVLMYTLTSPTSIAHLNEVTAQAWELDLTTPSIQILNEERALLKIVHKKRVQHLEQQCEKLQNQSGIDLTNSSAEAELALMLNHLLVDDRHKILYCYVPKVACTNWKRVLMVLTGRANTSNALSIPADAPHRNHNLLRLGSLHPSQIQKRLQTYSTFLFTRHPFERLLSAFKNKLEKRYGSSRYFQERIGRYIIKKYRSHPSAESLRKGNDVTFKEFVEYLVELKAQDYNEHWMPISHLCRLCSIHYDIIGKYESIAVDADYVLQNLGVADLVSFPQPQLISTTRSQMKKYFGQIPPDLLKKLYDIYALDFLLFDYSFSDIFK